jgi:anti-sigma factor (TIGR02949 family)
VKAESGPGGDFERLELPFLDSLYNFARWLAHDETEAEHLVQEAFTKALRGFSSFTPGTDFRAWIFRIFAHGGVSWEIGRTMNCTEWQNRIDAYVDAELQLSDMAAFRAHAKACAACATSALAVTESKVAIRSAASQYAAPPELRARIFALAKGEIQPARAESKRRWTDFGQFISGTWLRWALAAAALLLVAAGLFVAANRRQESKALAEFADLHVTNLASANPVEVISTDRHTVKPWFQGRIPFTFNLPELQGSPFTLVGGRVTYFHQEPGAHLIFAYQRHRISAFIFRETPQLGLPVSSLAGQASSFSLRTWTQGGLRYVVIGDAGGGTVLQLTELLHSAQ